jgi:hypothetical protein
MFLPNIEMNVPKSLNDGKKYDLLPILDEEEEKLKIIKNL